MKYIRKIFKQDLRDGTQIAFPTEPSNLFFEFDFNNPDPEREINFTFIENDSTSDYYDDLNNTVIHTRLYAVKSEARIDSQLKLFLIEKLNAQVDDIIIFSKKRNDSFEFMFTPQGTNNYSSYKSLLNRNHEIVLSENTPCNDSDGDKVILLNSKPKNTIYYGAPGTGKSHVVNDITKTYEQKGRVERVTFHPEYDYASFVGSYKPTMHKDDIRYEFVPQAFTNIYINAWNDLNNDYYLIIEEINRGNCSEIFGDIFQILDRTNDYKITPSKELKEYLDGQLNENPNIDSGKLLLPPNLSILATMNTSDQSLFPMDSAFKRRWDWEYVPINYEFSESNNSAKFKVKLSESESFSWLEFIQSVNTLIKSNDNLGVDKCLGNYFIKPDSDAISLNTFINKAIFYLWNDVFKDEMEEQNIFKDKTTYEDFFPIEENGLNKVKEVLDILEVGYKSSNE